MNNFIKIRVSNEEKESIKRKAGDNNISSYVRNRIFTSTLDQREFWFWLMTNYIGEIPESKIPDEESFFSLLKYLVESGLWKKLESRFENVVDKEIVL